jgi:arsenite methyltransferase
MPKRPDYGIDAPGVLIILLSIGVPVMIAAGIFLLEGVLMFIYVKWGKFRHRDRMLAQVPWTGGERVLDVGTGRGLLLIGAAKRLTTGNAAERTRANIQMEDVGGKDGSFDVVLSNLCIHNIPKQPGCGMAVISDYKLTKKYAALLAGEEFAIEWRGPFWRDTFPPLKMFVARKPS